MNNEFEPYHIYRIGQLSGVLWIIVALEAGYAAFLLWGRIYGH